MYSTEALYYLNQIGIVPWVSKHALNCVANIKPKLMVLMSLEPTKKSNALLDALLQYMELKSDEIIIQNPKSLDAGALLGSISSSTTIWSLGFNNQEVLSQIQGLCPMVSSLSLEQMLAEPLLKKNVFKDAAHIKQLLS